LAELPIVLPTQKEKGKIEKLVAEIKEKKQANAISKLNELVFNLYGLSEEEKNYILGKHEKTVNSIFTIKNNNLFNYAGI